jgi:ribose 5-phosphate isomerase A
MTTDDDYKRAAAAKALELVEPGMKIGLGTGSTAAHFVALLGARVKAGLDVVCVPTSEATAAQARALGIRLTTLDDEPVLDLTVDGADELDADLRLIKGGGGALLREKIVAVASDRMVVIASSDKRVETLGAFPLPVEVVRFGLASTTRMIEALASDVGCSGTITLRLKSDGTPFLTDSGNVILDCAFGELPDPETLDDVLRQIPGVVENGLFLGICDTAIIAGPDGVEVLQAHALFDLDNDNEEIAV